MKIFEIIHYDGEKEWVSGNTNLHALHVYISITECDLDSLQEAEIVELPRKLWSKYKVVLDDTPKITMSFSKWMKENRHRADIIAGTMYEF